ncbi:TIGR03620 family F420-dependent LLM class oxidoreductase [Conexibacter sp. JD483]|uniref:TIGR03620 family F420-dependent LLM class oxidoreductase n=1 Tax=unclassified Conexibacter TaxID=2627773 RepID=UPI0027165B0F|nr:MULTISPECIES: TIGR03620 family F420-dependent LLM class oxidoreductase [unclassified Conexibacter]MDO8186598.1 TIGR03620 family F420-dependent LLM class oxidoreductase [Conexibacter sp. CPCC 205706]MDO8196703.1 TIGR03620 family F420-dependent LLM class oxidoreductase [Conexibacter sp. CPCC 205762]MDR9371814.1 TIGR03620 family F420-dependent LLM class oxidoreductase [Conexibacter sp. JD483]
MSEPSAVPTARDRIGATGVWLSSLATVSAAEGAAAARTIERLGYGALWFGETPVGKEAYTHAGLLLSATERLVVATGIANIWARDARATVNAAEALGEAYPERFLLGLGVSHAPLVNMRGHDYAKPLAAMTAYLDGMTEAGASYAGPKADPPVPVVLAALGPKMVELSRDRTAGAHPYLITPEHTARTRALLGPAPLLAPEHAVVLESDPELAREVGRGFLKLYLTLPNYTRNLETLGFAQRDFADGGSDRLVDALVAWGDAETVVAKLGAHREAGADHVAIQPLAPTLEGQLEQLEELAPLLVP